jgi:hypothetical protein
MKLFSWAKDGGPESPVDAFFIIESKRFGSIVLLRFNAGGREAYHTHAFNALTWFITGDMVEQDIDGVLYTYKRSMFPKYTAKTKNHRVRAYRTSYCVSIRGPWASTWTEDTDTHHTVLTHGRQIVERHKQ